MPVLVYLTPVARSKRDVPNTDKNINMGSALNIGHNNGYYYHIWSMAGRKKGTERQGIFRRGQHLCEWATD